MAPEIRQAAIDALIEWYGCKPSDIDAFENIIKQLPSAKKPITNAERIRAMTDEELATWIDHIQADAYERGMMETPIVDYPNIYSEWLEWLKQEVDNR